jgi:putative addiction module killer protein/probable addiction module antidote protein
VPYEVEKTEIFNAWLDGLADRDARRAITSRIARVELGSLGDRRSVGEKVGELRINIGPGYRLYYTQRTRTIILLLCGGGKKTQRADIGKAEGMVRAMKGEEKAGTGRVRDRQSGYVAKGNEGTEFHFTAEELRVTPFDAADYLEDDGSQIYILRDAIESGEPAYIANAVGAVARARGLSGLERETGIRRQTLNKSLSLKGNPTLETLMTVLGALGLKLEIVEDRAKGTGA